MSGGNTMPDKNMIDKIIALEWKMFSSVNEGGPKASCQEDPVTFEGMRRAQFSAWSQEAVQCYLSDVEIATAEGRNLAMEKYIHMMKSTAPVQYSKLIEDVVCPSEEAAAVADKITKKMIEQTALLFSEYPYVSGAGRPLYSSSDFQGTTSVETYQKGELYTYSEATLNALWKHLCNLESAGKSLAALILENSVKFYGYNSLAESEAAMRKHAESQKLEFSFGCDNCKN